MEKKKEHNYKRNAQFSFIANKAFWVIKKQWAAQEVFPVDEKKNHTEKI